MKIFMTDQRELMAEINRLGEQVEALYAQAKKVGRGSPDFAAVHAERLRVSEQRDALLFMYLEEFDGEQPLYSEPVLVDTGFLTLVVQFLVKVRYEVNKELDRNDLTPYMWSMMRKRYDALSTTLGIIQGKRTKNIDFEAVPSHVLFAEFDDESVEWAEAYDEDEAVKMNDEFVANGAVVYKYRVVPESGALVLVHDPIGPFDNRHRPINAYRYRAITRMKGGEHFSLPDDLRSVVIDETNGRYRMHDVDDADAD
jgi:hypothetical protein